MKACAVTITLYNWSSPSNEPGWPSSIRISILSPVPNIPAQAPVIKYNVPISLWLHDHNHLALPVILPKFVLVFQYIINKRY